MMVKFINFQYLILKEKIYFKKSSFLAICFWALAIFYVPIATCQLFSTLSQILIVTFSVIILKEKYHWRYAHGIIFGIIGTIIIILKDKN